MDDLSTIRSEALGAVQQAADLAALEVARVAALGKKGSVTGLMKTLGGLAPDQRKEFGARVNQLKGEIEAALEARKGALSASALSARLVNEKVDVSLPARPEGQGSLHPIGQVMDELAAIFGEMGFTWADGPDIEDDWHNFTALNIPPDHPAPQMQDTFYLPPRADGTPGVLRIGAGDSWLEILGSGMVHPNVIANCGLDPAIYQGFAFGMGIDRIAMLKYGIPDLRSFFDSDLRWLRHYGFSALEWPSLTGGLGR